MGIGHTVAENQTNPPSALFRRRIQQMLFPAGQDFPAFCGQILAEGLDLLGGDPF